MDRQALRRLTGPAKTDSIRIKEAPIRHQHARSVARTPARHRTRLGLHRTPGVIPRRPECSLPLRLQPLHLAKFCQSTEDTAMTTMNISLPGALKTFVDEQVTQRGYGTSSEYVRELIRKDQDRSRLREMLLAGGASEPAGVADSGYFEGLRVQLRKPGKTGARS